MRVEVHLVDQSCPVVRTNVHNTYQEGKLFCVMHRNGSVEKYPITRLFRVIETPEEH